MYSVYCNMTVYLYLFTPTFTSIWSLFLKKNNYSLFSDIFEFTIYGVTLLLDTCLILHIQIVISVIIVQS